jgi:hypothetical protein
VRPLPRVLPGLRAFRGANASAAVGLMGSALALALELVPAPAPPLAGAAAVGGPRFLRVFSLNVMVAPLNTNGSVRSRRRPVSYSVSLARVGGVG